MGAEHKVSLEILTESGKTVALKSGEPLPAERFVITSLRFLGDSPKFTPEGFFALVAKLTTLKEVVFDGCWLAFSDEQLDFFANTLSAKSLTAMSIGFELNFKTIEILRKFTHLEVLNCRANHAVDSTIKQLVFNFPNIKWLGLIGLGKSGDISQVGFQQLVKLRLDGLYLWDPIILTPAVCRDIAQTLTIRELFTSRGNITDEGVAELVKSPGIIHIMLPHTSITDISLVHLAGMKQLQLVEVTKTKVTADGVKKLALARPDLRIEWDGGTIEPKK